MHYLYWALAFMVTYLLSALGGMTLSFLAKLPVIGLLASEYTRQMGSFQTGYFSGLIQMMMALQVLVLGLALLLIGLMLLQKISGWWSARH
jgi:hypothetical protein